VDDLLGSFRRYDALCINQRDISERNEQVRHMPHIYTYARTVLIWLGAISYPRTSADQESVRVDKWLLPYLCSADYWGRLWIIQEVIKAQEIEVHFNGGQLSWNDFITGIEKQPKLAGCTPLKLTRQMREKYGEACKLENLLKAHQKALCKDPRDKVYDLVGLAIDCDGAFPMDYRKSVFQVWKDLVLFRYSDETANPREPTNFARFARRLFQNVDGGACSSTRLSESDRADNNPYVQTLASISGRILYLGPTWRDLVSNPALGDRWTSAIRKRVAKDDWPLIGEENDRLMQIIYRSRSSVLNQVSNFNGSQSYPLSERIHKLESYPHTLRPSKSGKLDIWFKSPEAPEATQKPRLFLLDGSISPQSNGIAMVGLVAPGAEIGDFICHYPQCERAIVARLNSNRAGIELIGTAVVAQDVQTATRKNSNKSSAASVWGIQGRSSLQDTEVDLDVRIDTLYEFLL
jgi:Heterokaryon incompatibility protein (HET)